MTHYVFLRESPFSLMQKEIEKQNCQLWAPDRTEKGCLQGPFVTTDTMCQDLGDRGHLHGLDGDCLAVRKCCCFTEGYADWMSPPSWKMRVKRNEDAPSSATGALVTSAPTANHHVKWYWRPEYSFSSTYLQVVSPKPTCHGPIPSPCIPRPSIQLIGQHPKRFRSMLP